MIFLSIGLLLSVSLVCFLSWGFLTHLSYTDFFSQKKQSLPRWLTDIPIAHRGLHHGQAAPENTLEAFRQARDAGFGIELDTHLTQDNVVVVHHDQNVERMTGKEAHIKDLTLAQIQDLRVLGTDHTIPTLQDVLTLIDGQVPLYVEIKNETGPVGTLESKVYEAIKEYKGPLAVISFNPETIKWFKDHAPEILRGQTSCGYMDPEDQSIPAFSRFVLKNFLLNWRSQPHFLLYELGHVENSLSLKFLKQFKVVMTYGAHNEPLLKKAIAFSENYMFDHVGDQILQLRGHTISKK